MHKTPVSLSKYSSPGFLSCLILFLLAFAVPAQGALELMTQVRYPPSGKPALASGLPGDASARLYWVQFRDKGFEDAASLQARLDTERLAANPRALARRAKVLPQEEIVQIGDLPVHGDYVRILRNTGAAVRSESRWFNAVSVEAAGDQIREIARLPFVHAVETVKSGRRPIETVKPAGAESTKAAAPAGRYDYGLSANQVRQIRADQLHDLGLTGKGIVIGVLDTGFAPESIAALDHADILGRRDFVDGDDNPAETPDHGTSTLSCIAAFAPGSMIGAAWEASFLLGRTEIEDREVHLEEDLWNAGVEWMEREGVDIVSSSLGYVDFDDGSIIIMDGVSSTVTRSASAAVERGVFVVNSAGNAGFGGIGAPSDGFNVCAVGAVNAAGAVAAFSSRGPTVDGRIKPDVSAQGSDTLVADTRHLSGPIWSTDPLPAGDILLVTSETPLAADSGRLTVSFLLVDNGTGNAAFGHPGLGFAGGAEITLRRGGSAYVLFNSPFNESILRAPSPAGFAYSGSRVISVGSAFETAAGNDHDIALSLDLTRVLPSGGIAAGDVLRVVTSARRTIWAGLRIYTLTDADRHGFGYSSGTSFSCPLVAGAAALLLQANPGWGPKDLLNALRGTASNSGAPNNNTGWGIANAYLAAFNSPVPASADLDGDGSVGPADMITFTEDWRAVHGRNETDWGVSFRSDLNRDFRLDPADLLLFTEKWAP